MKHAAFPMKRTLLLFLLLSLVVSQTAMAAYVGRVMDTERKPLEGIVVSDGLNVTQTDAEGRFQLEGWERARFVNVSTPAGLRAVENRFYQPVDPEITEYRFVLEPYERSTGDTVRFAQISDIETDTMTAWIPFFRRAALEQHCAFAILTGDHCRRDGLEFNARLVNSQTMGLSMYNTLGNHDFVKNEDDPPHGEWCFEKHFGPCWFSFDAGPIHFVITPMKEGEAPNSFSSIDLARWLKNDLAYAKDKPVCFFNHGIRSYQRIDDEQNFLLGEGEDQIDLRKCGVRAYIFGHHHNNLVHTDPASGITFATVSTGNTGGKDHAPANIVIYTLDKNGVKSVDTRETYVDHHIALTSPQASRTAEAHALPKQVLAQIYDTGVSVKAARWTLRLGDRVLATGDLKPVFDWTWGAEIPAMDPPEETPETNAAPLRLEIAAEFTDGQSRADSVTLSPQNPERIQILKEAWTTNVGGNLCFASVLPVQGGLLAVTGTGDQPAANAVVKLDENGQILWKSPLQNAVKSAMALGTLADGTPVVFVSDVAWNVYAVNAQTGEQLWCKALGAHAYVLENGPAFANGLVYAGQAETLCALDAATGETRWTNSEWKGGIVTAVPHAVLNGRLLVASNWDALYAHDPQTGKLLWQASDKEIRYRTSQAIEKDAPTDTTPGTLLITANRALKVLDQATGETLRSGNSGMSLQTLSTPVLWQNDETRLILVGTIENGLAAFDAQTLRLQWLFHTGENLAYSAAYTAPPCSTVETTVVPLGGKYVLFGALDGCLYVLEPKAGAGKLVQKLNLGAPVLAPVTVQGNRVYVTDFSGNVHALEVNLP